MGKDNTGWVLYEADSTVPILCERENWKTCPEHRMLTEERPNVKQQKVDVDDSDIVDDPDDDIISVNEYSESAEKPAMSKEQKEAIEQDAYDEGVSETSGDGWMGQIGFMGGSLGAMLTAAGFSFGIVSAPMLLPLFAASGIFTIGMFAAMKIREKLVIAKHKRAKVKKFYNR